MDDEQIDFTETFKFFDDDGDNQITSAELKLALR